MSYISVTELKNEKDISEDADDDILGAIIDQVTAAIESYTNRKFDANKDTTRYYTYDNVQGQWLWLDGDLCELTSIANGDSSGTAISTSDVTLWPRNEGPPYYKIRLDFSSSSSWEVDTDYYIAITGKWGYSKTPPADIRRACLRWSLYMYAQRDAQVFDVTAIPEEGVLMIPQGMPQDVKILLTPYRRLAPVL